MILLKIMYRWQLSMDICICIASKPAYSKERIVPWLPRCILSSRARPSAESFQRIILHAILQFANGMFSCEFPLTPAETQLQIWLSFQNEFQILWKQRQEKMFYSLFNIFWSSFWDGLKITFSIKVVFMFNTLTSKTFKLHLCNEITCMYNCTRGSIQNIHSLMISHCIKNIKTSQTSLCPLCHQAEHVAVVILETRWRN